MSRLAPPLLVSVAVASVLVGCGGAPVASEPCVITASGNKLCGDDAKSWCERFAADADAETLSACREAGADLAGGGGEPSEPGIGESVGLGNGVDSTIDTDDPDAATSMYFDGDGWRPTQDYSDDVEAAAAAASDAAREVYFTDYPGAGDVGPFGIYLVTYAGKPSKAEKLKLKRTVMELLASRLQNVEVELDPYTG